MLKYRRGSVDYNVNLPTNGNAFVTGLKAVTTLIPILGIILNLTSPR